MIRSPQALLVSLSLHALMGALLLFAVAPRILSPQEGEMQRCRIALSHVISAAAPAPRLQTAETLPKKTVAPRVQPPVKSVAPPVGPKAVATSKRETVRTAEPPAEKPREAVETAAVGAEAVQRATPAQEANDASVQPMPAAEMPAAVLPRQDGGSYVNEHLATIARLLRENLYYPKLARKRHIEGEVLAAFTLQTDGTISDVTVKKHARDILDRAAVRTIESLSGRLPHPKNPLTLEVPIRFVLK